MRLIDADALVKEISVSHTMTDDCGIKTGYEISMRLVEDAPTIEPRPRGRWIPVTERLPEENGMYLVTMTEKAKAEELGFDLDEIEVSKMRYNSNGWQLPRHIPSWINEVVKDEVIAWMPLPEPYREVSE